MKHTIRIAKNFIMFSCIFVYNIYGQVAVSKNDSALIVNAAALISIGTTTATFSGSYITDTDSLVTACGVCFGTKPNPSLNNNKTFENIFSGSFISRIRNLMPNTKYYVRSYVVNRHGTTYGPEISFTTHLSNAVADIDGNYYNMVNIGTQVWLTEDLKTTRYHDGTPIARVADEKLWGLVTNGAYCWYGNDSVKYSFPHGKIYNWYAVNTGKLCPTGWHVPSDAEWTVLRDFLGGDSIAGGKLKIPGLIYWRNPNKQATDESGFSAIPGGYRNTSGLFYYVTIFDNWWSSNGIAPEGASYWYVYHATGYLYQNIALRMMGYSVRCLKDQ